ncbi:MAG: matrixin family metalloprotease [Myxococcota bacterium]|jgi:hypothetical protein|nr:matrixin family metalloprotease [Myxococcota bacterium]
MRSLFVVSVLMLASSPAQAWRGVIGKWNLSNSPNVGFRIRTTGAQRSNINDGSDVRAIRSALQSWTDATCSVVAGQDLGNTQGSPRAARDGTNNIWFESDAGSWPHGPGTLGITSTFFSGRGCNASGTRPYANCWVVDADVQFNEVNYPSQRGNWGTADRGRHIDIQSIAVHEIGHALGIDHPCENCTVDSVMTPAYVGYPFRYLRQDDTDAVCSLYPGQRGGLGWGCVRNTDCDSNLCVIDGDSRYCSQACGSCPAGYDCQQNSGRNVCLRADALADAAARGEICVGRPCQEGLICLGGESDARCYKTCNRGDAPCPAGTTCRTFGEGNEASSLCIDGGDTEEGEACDSYYACAEGLECAPTGRGWTCARVCTADSQCGSDGECVEVERQGVDTIRVCVDRRTARLGERCEGKPCEEGTSCVYSNGDRLCFQNCRSRADCTSGMDCQPIQSGGGVCAPYVGDDCVDDLDCPRGQICEELQCSQLNPAEAQPIDARCGDDSHCQSGACGYFDGVGRCGRGCDLRLGHFQCPEGQGCAEDQMGNGLCSEGSDLGSGEVGDSCTGADQCKHGICTNNRCLTWCGDNSWCPQGYGCDQSIGEPGVCEFRPTGDNPNSPFGCGCGSATGVGLEWLLFAGILRRRRRKKTA